jgi:carbonic anhydrase
MEINGGIGPEDALSVLSTGNQRFASGGMTHPHLARDWREKVEHGQSPIAVIVTCSDSRVVPEFIFDQGLGDLYVIRTAGHTLNKIIIGSIEYAVTHLGIPLVYVLGHHKCLEVASSVFTVEAPQPVGTFNEVAENIMPAYAAVENKDGDWIYNTVLENVNRVVNTLKEHGPVLSDYCAKGKIKIVGGMYSLKTGLVDQFV